GAGEDAVVRVAAEGIGAGDVPVGIRRGGEDLLAGGGEVGAEPRSGVPPLVRLGAGVAGVLVGDDADDVEVTRVVRVVDRIRAVDGGPDADRVVGGRAAVVRVGDVAGELRA